MLSSYSKKQNITQKNDGLSASSVFDASSQSQSLQHKADMANNAAQRVETPRPNNTGMPDDLKAGIESLSGFSMDDVRVHYNSPKPATVQALAYTQGTDIHVAPGQEKHLPHEAWHVAQQMAGRVSPTTNINGMPVNDNAALEHEADVMGEKAVQCKENDILSFKQRNFCKSIIQCLNVTEYVKDGSDSLKKIPGECNSISDLYKAALGSVFLEFSEGEKYKGSTVKFIIEKLIFLITKKGIDENSFYNQPRLDMNIDDACNSLIDVLKNYEAYLKPKEPKKKKDMSKEGKGSKKSGGETEESSRGQGDHLFNDICNEICEIVGVRSDTLGTSKELTRLHELYIKLFTIRSAFKGCTPDEYDENTVAYCLALGQLRDAIELYKEGEDVRSGVRSAMKSVFENSVDHHVERSLQGKAFRKENLKYPSDCETYFNSLQEDSALLAFAKAKQSESITRSQLISYWKHFHDDLSDALLEYFQNASVENMARKKESSVENMAKKEESDEILYDLIIKKMFDILIRFNYPIGWDALKDVIKKQLVGEQRNKLDDELFDSQLKQRIKKDGLLVFTYDEKRISVKRKPIIWGTNEIVIGDQSFGIIDCGSTNFNCLLLSLGLHDDYINNFIRSCIIRYESFLGIVETTMGSYLDAQSALPVLNNLGYLSSDNIWIYSNRSSMWFHFTGMTLDHVQVSDRLNFGPNPVFLYYDGYCHFQKMIKRES